MLDPKHQYVNPFIQCVSSGRKLQLDKEMLNTIKADKKNNLNHMSIYFLITLNHQLTPLIPLILWLMI